MKYLVIDIETVRDPGVFWMPPEGKDDPFPPPPCHRVACVGWATLDTNKLADGAAACEVVSVGATYGESENAILAWFAAGLAKAVEGRRRLVTFNGRRFDMPVLLSRSMGASIPIPAWWGNPELSIRYKEAHTDLADVLTLNGAGPASSLATWASLIGAPGKLASGGDVAGMVERGAWEEVVGYCLGDVDITTRLLAALLVSRGEITKEQAAAIGAALEEAKSAPRLIRGML